MGMGHRLQTHPAMKLPDDTSRDWQYLLAVIILVGGSLGYFLYRVLRVLL